MHACPERTFFAGNDYSSMIDLLFSDSKTNVGDISVTCALNSPYFSVFTSIGSRETKTITLISEASLVCQTLGKKDSRKAPGYYKIPVFVLKKLTRRSNSPSGFHF